VQVINVGYFNRVLGSLLLTALLTSCSAKGNESVSKMAPPPDIEVAVVSSEEVILWGAFTGRIAAPETVELRPRVSGYIDQVSFSEGDVVQQGELLFVIDQRLYQARERLAQAELDRMQSQLALASSEAERAINLWERRAISREELEQRTASVVAARAGVNAASASLESALLELEYTHIKAPITGRIGRTEVTRGNLATADTSLLATLVSVDPIYVYFESAQQTAEDNPSELQAKVPVRIELDSESGDYYIGELDFVDNQYNARTGTLQYRAVFANPDYRFRPGQFARVEMPVTQARQTILLDQKAVLTDQDRRYVYVLDEDDRTSRRYVEIGRRFEGLVVVRDGLEPGERVVVNGLQKIAFPGMQVTPRMVDMRRSQPLPVIAGNASG
jgi:multidrug efflux system membrane fusion protein